MAEFSRIWMLDIGCENLLLSASISRTAARTQCPLSVELRLLVLQEPTLPARSPTSADDPKPTFVFELSISQNWPEWKLPGGTLRLVLIQRATDIADVSHAGEQWLDHSTLGQ